MITEMIKENHAKEDAILTVAHPNPEVPDKAVRRRFTAEYKMRILSLADACTEPGSLGALLRREGLYASICIEPQHVVSPKGAGSTFSPDTQKAGPQGNSPGSKEPSIPACCRADMSPGGKHKTDSSS